MSGVKYRAQFRATGWLEVVFDAPEDIDETTLNNLAWRQVELNTMDAEWDLMEIEREDEDREE